MKMPLLSITTENFQPFGRVIEFSEGFEDSFEIIITEEEKPWRIAVYRYSDKTIHRLENHPTSKESFEPLKGVTVLVVAENQSPNHMHAFLLDKPICLYKGIWHQVLPLTAEAQVKITENLEVSSEFFDLEKPVGVFLTTAES